MNPAFSRQQSAVGGQAERSSAVVDRAQGGTKNAGATCRAIASAILNLSATLLWTMLLAWLLGRMLTDRYAWSQWLWWIPTPAILIASALGFVLAFRGVRDRSRRRRRVLAWSVVNAALIGWFALAEQRLLRAAPPLPPANSAMTAAHWNITLDNRADIAAIMQQIATLDADLLAITVPPTEVRRLLSEEAGRSTGALQVIDYWPVCIVSRLPILRARVLVWTDGIFIAQIDLDAQSRLGRALIVNIVDLPSNPQRPRMQIARHARRLLDDIQAPRPDLVLGDCNITRGSASLHTLFPGCAHAFSTGGHGYAGTFPRTLPLYHIDHLLVDKRSGLRAVRYDTLDLGMSRHRAQKAWLNAARAR